MIANYTESIEPAHLCASAPIDTDPIGVGSACLYESTFCSSFLVDPTESLYFPLVDSQTSSREEQSCLYHDDPVDCAEYIVEGVVLSRCSLCSACFPARL